MGIEMDVTTVNIKTYYHKDPQNLAYIKCFKNLRNRCEFRPNVQVFQLMLKTVNDTYVATVTLFWM